MAAFLGFGLTADAADLRRRLLEEITRFPGLHLREIARTLDIAPSHAQYHLRVLEKTQLIRSDKETSNVRYYPTVPTPLGRLPQLDARQRSLVGLLRRPALLRILVVLVVEAPLSLTKLSFRCGLTPSTVLHHLQRLLGEGLVVREESAAQVLWRVRDPTLVRRLLLEHEPPPRYLEGFLETWQRLSP